MTITLERPGAGEPDPDRNRNSGLSQTHLAKLATYMNGGFMAVVGRSFDFPLNEKLLRII